MQLAYSPHFGSTAESCWKLRLFTPASLLRATQATYYLQAADFIT